MKKGDDEQNKNEEKCREQPLASDQRRRPLLYLMKGSKDARQQYLRKGVPLYRAALSNDWTGAATIIREDREILHAAITTAEETVLHVAAGAKHVQFVKKLLTLMREEEVESQDCNGNTAFCLAVASGSIEIVVLLMQKNARLPLIPGGHGKTPLYMAALFAHAEIAWLLYSTTKATAGQEEWRGIFFTCIDSDLYGLALKMFEDDSTLALARDVNGDNALHVLARKPLAFLKKSSRLRKSYTRMRLMSSCDTNYVESDALKLTKGLWNEILVQLPYLEVKQIIDEPSRFLFEAAELGNFQFLLELIHSYPDLVWEVDEKNRTIFHVAVLNRHANIFNLLHEIGYVKDVILTFEDTEKNNMLHLAATLPPQHKRYPELGGLQLHHDLIWFEAVKKIMQPSYAERKNSNGLTPKDVFTLSHSALFKDGESWMKGTATSCLLVSLLVTTIAFIAAFQFAINGKERSQFSSHVLSVLESLTLVSSSIATLVFLSILTSSYGEMDFLCLLPLKLSIGLVTLLVSMSTMMVAFMGRLFISLPHGLKWVPTTTFIGTFIPVTLFILMQQFRLLWKLWDSAFLYRLLSGKVKSMCLVSDHVSAGARNHMSQCGGLFLIISCIVVFFFFYWLMLMTRSLYHIAD